MTKPLLCSFYTNTLTHSTPTHVPHRSELEGMLAGLVFLGKTPAGVSIKGNIWETGGGPGGRGLRLGKESSVLGSGTRDGKRSCLLRKLKNSMPGWGFGKPKFICFAVVDGVGQTGHYNYYLGL